MKHGLQLDRREVHNSKLMSLQRCFSTLGCPNFTLAEACALATRHDVSALELRALGGTIELPKYFAEQFGSPATLAARVQESGRTVVALGTSLRLASATEKDREQFLAWLPWAEALGARWLRVFEGGTLASEAEISQAVATLAWWRTVRAEQGWRAEVMVETHDALFTVAAIERFLALAPGTKILWDTHHTWRKGGEDPLVTWPRIRDHVVHVHVKDSRSVADGTGNFEYVEPGSGEFPFEALVRRLRAEAFAGAVSLEWEKLWHPKLGSLADAMSAAARHGW